MKRIVVAIIALGLMAVNGHAGTTLLPNGKQCFQEATGPISSGSVNMFVPNTTNPKTTWKDPNQQSANSNPIQLDSNGCAVIYGTGSYRQQVYDGPVVSGQTTGNLIWDQLTTDTSASNSLYWAGTAGGSPNAITITDTGFNGTDGTAINFLALSTNTGAATLNPSGYFTTNPPIPPILKMTSAGPVSVAAGDITASNLVSVIYSTTLSAFLLQNLPQASASGSTNPLCGATGLSIKNDSGTPAAIMDIVAASAVAASATSVINRSSVSVTANTSIGTSTSTAGGMDGEAPGTNAWLYIWLIDNGAGPSALYSLAAGHGLLPVLPSGYTFKCRIGAARVDGSGNLYHSIQLGQKQQWVIGTNPATSFIAANGVAGTYSATSPTLVSVALSSYVPPTAVSVRLVGNGEYGAGTASAYEIAPNSSYSGSNNGPGGSNGNTYPIWSVPGTGSESADIVLENQAAPTVYWASSQAGGAISVSGYTDSVNAQ